MQEGSWLKHQSQSEMDENTLVSPSSHNLLALNAQAAEVLESAMQMPPDLNPPRINEDADPYCDRPWMAGELHSAADVTWCFSTDHARGYGNFVKSWDCNGEAINHWRWCRDGSIRNLVDGNWCLTRNKDTGFLGFDACNTDKLPESQLWYTKKKQYFDFGARVLKHYDAFEIQSRSDHHCLDFVDPRFDSPLAMKPCVGSTGQFFWFKERGRVLRRGQIKIAKKAVKER